MLYTCPYCRKEVDFTHLETFLRKHDLFGSVPKTELYQCSACGHVIEVKV